MALVNPQIAMSFRPTTEYQPRNALAEYAQLQAIQAGRQAQELNALKMQEAQAALEERNALRSLNPSSEDYESQLFKVSPQLGIQFRREAAATAAQRAAQQKSEFDLTTARRKFAEDLKRGLSANPSDENIIAFGQDALLQNLYTPDQVKSEVSRLLALPVPDRVRILSQAGASAADLRPQVIGGRLVSSAGNVLYAAPSAIGAIEAEIAALKAQGAADTDPRIVARQGKIRQLSGAPGPTEIANIEAEIAALKGQGVADTDPRIVARQNKIRQLSGAPGPTEIANIEAEIATLKGQGVADTDPRIVARQGKIRQLSGAPGPTEIANVEAEVAALRAQGVPDTDPRIVARQNKIRQLSGAPGPTEIAVLETEIAALKAQGAADTDPRIVTRQGKITQLSGGPAPAEIRTMQSLGYPLTQAGYASFRAAQMRETPPALVPILRDGKPVLVPRDEAVGQTPFSPASVQVLGMGPQREAPAPTITQIQDPTDPSRMITIDARRYQGGGVGSPGVIGASGKSAPAQAAAVKQEQGLTKADDILTQLQSAYAQLKERKAIPSEQTSALTNIWASIAASGVGQVAGRAVGTAAQTQRDIIQSSRNQLLLAIKDATGLSAQQLNSNMELQTWLSSLTDPTRSIEANEAILQNVRKFIDSGGKYTARGGAGAGATPTPAGRGAATGGRDLGNGFKLVD